MYTIVSFFIFSFGIYITGSTGSPGFKLFFIYKLVNIYDIFTTGSVRHIVISTTVNML
jgi:hypothetical protein